MHPIRERFAKEHGFTEQETHDLVFLANQAKQYNTRECNGDAHPEARDVTDKNECASLWGRDLERVTQRIAAIAGPKGLTVEYTGLRPCLRDAAGHYVEIPH